MHSTQGERIVCVTVVVVFFVVFVFCVGFDITLAATNIYNG